MIGSSGTKSNAKHVLRTFLPFRELVEAKHVKTLLLSEVFPPQTGGSGRWFWEVYSRLPRERFALRRGSMQGRRRLIGGMT